MIIDINNLLLVLNGTGPYLNAENIGVFYQDNDVAKIEKVLNKEWFTHNKLSINFRDDKTKAIFLLKKKPTRTKHSIRRLLSKTSQYCRTSIL